MGKDNRIFGLFVKMKRSEVSVLVGILILAYMGWMAPQRIVFSFTNSVGHRLFYYKPNPAPQQINKGDFVVFDIQTDLIPHCRPCKVVKMVGCIEGESLKSTDDGAYFCEKEFLGLAKSRTKKGQPLSRFSYEGKVPDQCIFATSNHIDGYDSRYFGFVEKNRIVGIALPLL